MKIENVLDTKNSLELYGLDNYLDNLISLFEKKKFAKTRIQIIIKIPMQIDLLQGEQDIQ